ncbi:hypothetical protein K469DRAFT_90241 [Zopfia rhizophila CBS 207.26]|uniref:Uncharacterized protein n=1 Tax=Zopfia rhizophila CBS 207.26 TaxID=1314779 RepID=A0A6A6EAT2_9PEZI|nr:hypothetical protein K469DRAFT_90241 [Zopfia rhizophila CBS 207.26]
MAPLPESLIPFSPVLELCASPTDYIYLPKSQKFRMPSDKPRPIWGPLTRFFSKSSNIH